MHVCASRGADARRHLGDHKKARAVGAHDTHRVVGIAATPARGGGAITSFRGASATASEEARARVLWNLRRDQSNEARVGEQHYRHKRPRRRLLAIERL